MYLICVPYVYLICTLYVCLMCALYVPYMVVNTVTAMEADVLRRDVVLYIQMELCHNRTLAHWIAGRSLFWVSFWVSFTPQLDPSNLYC